MNDIEHEQIRARIAEAMRSLGAASNLDDRYFRFQKAIGAKKTAQTTVAVYFRGVGANLLEFAFETGAAAESIGRQRIDVAEWVSMMREATGRDVHPNPRFDYPRIGIANKGQLEDILTKWEIFTGQVAAKPAAKGEEFVSVPFYIESDGSKTLFLPELRRPGGFQIGEKDNERYIADYWEALAALREMPVPRFRRPNKNNIPGIIACKAEDTDEVKRSYIEDHLTRMQA